jgi:hypothetical protein
MRYRKEEVNVLGKEGRKEASEINERVREDSWNLKSK